MTDTRNPSGAPDNLSKEIHNERSLLRGDRPAASQDQRPAGPSTASTPGMGDPAAPMPPGMRSSNPVARAANANVAGKFRYDFANEPDKDAWANRRDLVREH